MNKTILTSLLVLSGALPVTLSHAMDVAFLPVITNYEPSSYNAGLQNWSCAQDESGVMYFGNNRGLLSFNGYRWHLTPLPGNATVRSVLADGNKIYVGSYTDFGYFKRDEYGSLTYTSLYPRDYKSHNDEIWKIVKLANGHVYFQSFCSWFDYDGRKVTYHYNPSTLPLHFFSVNDRVYVQMMGGGVSILRGGKYAPLLSRAAFGGDDVVSCVPMPNEKVLFITVRNGIFIYDGKRLSPMKSLIDADLRLYQVNKAIMASHETLVIGTLLNGVYAININTGGLLWHYNMENGLRNNTVLGLLNDKDDNVWAALDGGVALIHAGLPITIMNTERLRQPIGMVYGVTISGSNMYVATNQATWNYSQATGNLSQIQGTSGQNWYVCSFDNQVFAGNNFFTASIQGNDVSPLPGDRSGSTCLRRYTGYGQDVLIESTYSGFRVYNKVGGTWTLANDVKGFQAPILEFEIDNTGTIWAAHMSQGLYRVSLSKDLSQVTSTRYYGSLASDGIPSLIHVTKVEGRVVFSYGDKIYTQDDMRHAIVEYEELGRLLPSGLISSTPVDNKHFWVSDSNGWSLMEYDRHSYSRLYLIPYEAFGLEANETALGQYVSANHTYFFLNNGVGRVPMETRGRDLNKYPLNIMNVTYVKAGNKTMRATLYDGEDNEVEADNVRVILSYPNYNNLRYAFTFRLEGNGDTIITRSNTPSVTFNDLGYARYKIFATVSSPDGKQLAQVTYSFRHAAPWYLSTWAFVIYAMALFLAIRAYVIWRTRKAIAKSQREAEEKLIRQNIKTLEQRQAIAAQQQELMEQALTDKGKELATMALQAVARNNSNETLREELLAKRRNGKLQMDDFKKLITLMEGGDDDDVWAIFQQNFDLIHKHFFRNLRREYPDLTPTDLRFCALLRLNLNTKEIARFTNLTVRGVEGARYRLRRKLRIQGDQSLTDFLIDLE